MPVLPPNSPFSSEIAARKPISARRREKDWKQPSLPFFGLVQRPFFSAIRQTWPFFKSFKWLQTSEA
jgi:hypothetical protein